MKHFTTWTGKTPDELLTEAEEEIKSGRLMRQRNIKKYLTGFRKHLQDLDLAPITVKGYMTGVKSFYQLFDIELPKLPRLDRKAKPLEKHNKIPTKEDLQEVLKICDPLERAVLLVGASSGLSSNEITSLKVGDVTKGYDETTGITTLVVRREKTGVDFVTFLTPEAGKAVSDYLNFRGRTDKKQEVRRQNQLEKQRVFTDNDYLFIKRNISEEYIKKRDEEKRALDTAALIKIYRAISEKAQKNTQSGDWNLIRSHNIRKYFNSALLNAGADSFFVEFTMGHQLDATRAAYFRASPAKLREIYKRFIPFLTVQKELDISESPEYLAIKKENEILRAETERHVVTRHDFQDIRDAINSLVVQTPPLGPAATEGEIKRYANKKKLEERATALQESMKKIFHID